jgi:putative ABC transport system permease protein
MRIAALAFRNLLRNRRRSMTTLLAMIVGTVSILLFGGYMRYIVYAMQTGYVRGYGHLQLQHRDYFLFGSGDPAAYGIANYQHVIDVVKADPVLAPMLTMATPFIQFGGIAGNFDAGASRTVIATGAVIAEQNITHQWNDYHFPGTAQPATLTGTSIDAAIIGGGVARVLQLCEALKVRDCPSPPPVARSNGEAMPQDVALLTHDDPPLASSGASTGPPTIELLAATTTGAPNVSRLKVVKAERQGDKNFDDVFIAMHLEQAQRLLYGSSEPEVTSIQVQLKHTSQIPLAQRRLQQLLDTMLKDQPLAVYDFRTLNPYYDQTIGWFTAMFSFIATLIGVIVLFTVGNTMNAAVVERTVEIGTLRAMGLRRVGIRKLFVSEGLLLGLIGSTLGVAVAMLIGALINHSGMTWTPPGSQQPTNLYIRVWGEIPMLIGTALGLMMVATLSAWWPARRAACLPVVEALRHV